MIQVPEPASRKCEADYGTQGVDGITQRSWPWK